MSNTHTPYQTGASVECRWTDLMGAGTNPDLDEIHSTITQLACHSCGNQQLNKIDTATYQCTRCFTRTTIGVSNHAEDRWKTRAADSTTTPVEAWGRGTPIGAPTLESMHCHEARFDASTETLLLRNNDTIITVYSIHNIPSDAAQEIYAIEQVALLQADSGVSSVTL